MDEHPSILEKIISSKETAEMEQFHPAEVTAQLMKELSSKEMDILNRRHSLNGVSEQTLEEIGKAYRVTRERVRQIEKGAIAKMKKSRNFASLLHATERTMMTILTRHGGVLEERALLRDVLSYAGQTQANMNAVLFLLREMLDDKFSLLPADTKLRAAWKVKPTSLEFFEALIAELLRVIDAIGAPVTFAALYERFQATPFFAAHRDRLTSDVVNAAVGLSQEISKNPFDEYGRTRWGSIIPRRMNDKIALVLRKAGKPLHFVEITRLINEAGFDHRTAYPPTVHNELILNDAYVLIGRGIYALREWGYQPGVVAEVIVRILKETQRPLTRQEIVEAVLKQRMVKRNTIHLALTNRALFRRGSDGTYGLADDVGREEEPREVA